MGVTQIFGHEVSPTWLCRLGGQDHCAATIVKPPGTPTSYSFLKVQRPESNSGSTFYGTLFYSFFLLRGSHARNFPLAASRPAVKMAQGWGLLVHFCSLLSLCLGREGQGAFLRVKKEYLEEGKLPAKTSLLLLSRSCSHPLTVMIIVRLGGCPFQGKLEQGICLPGHPTVPSMTSDGMTGRSQLGGLRA